MAIVGKPQRPETSPPAVRAPPPDLPAIHKELQTHKDPTLELLWQEYKQANSSGYSLAASATRAQNLTLLQGQPGEKMFVGYAGASIPSHDRATGEIHQAPIFVVAMG